MAVGLQALCVLFILLMTGYSKACTDGDVRFDPEITGRIAPIQICTNDHWGYVCARNYSLDRWTFADANVFCMQFNNSVATEASRYVLPDSLINSSFPLSFQTVYCNGFERRLIDCSHDDGADNTNSNACRIVNNNNNNIFHYYASATCSSVHASCITGAVEINEITGLVRICTNGAWNLLCTQYWSESEAQVICREKGFNPKGAQNITVTSSVHPIANLNFHCFGDESKLTECSVTTFTDCPSVQTAAGGVICGVSPEAPAVIEAYETTYPLLSLTIYWSFVNNTVHYTVYCTDQLLTTISQVINGNHNSTIIYGLLSNTSYTCCVSTITQDGRESSTTCTNITTSILPDSQCNNTNDNDDMVTMETFVLYTTCNNIPNSLSTVSPSILYTTSSSTQSISPHTTLIPSSSNIIHITTTNASSNSSMVTSWIGGVVIGTLLGSLSAILVVIMSIVCYKRIKSTKKLMTMQRDSFVVNEPNTYANRELQNNTIYDTATITNEDRNLDNPLYATATNNREPHHLDNALYATATNNREPHHLDNPLYASTTNNREPKGGMDTFDESSFYNPLYASTERSIANTSIDNDNTYTYIPHSVTSTSHLI